MKKMLQHIALVLLLLIGLQSLAQVDDKDLVSFGGHAFTYGFPIEKGYAELYNADTIVIDTAIIDTLGYYYFYKKPSGFYFIRAFLAVGDPNFQDFFPTCYPDYSDLSFAKPVEVIQDNWELDISMFYANGSDELGPGKINGNLTIGENRIEIEGIDVQVRDESGKPFRHAHTDRFGNFEISELPFGSYTLYPQILGYQTIPYHFEISDSQSNYDNIIMTIKNGQISSYINENIVDQNSFMCYPNPANQTLQLTFDFEGSQQIQTRVMDITGRIIFEESDDSINNYYKQLNTSNWENGYYFVEVLANGTRALSQKVAVLH